MHKAIILLALCVVPCLAASAQEKWVLSPFQPPDNLPFEEVRAITETPDGALWFASWSGGVARLHGSDWRVYTREQGLIYDYVRTVAPDRANGVWVGSEEGISHISGDTITNYTRASVPIMPDPTVVSALRLRNGRVWFGTLQGAVFECDDSGVADPSAEQSRDGWVDSEGRAWRVVLPLDPNRAGTVWDMCETSDGSIWLAFDNLGASVYRKGEWRHFPPGPDFLTARVKSVVETRDGRIWVAGGGPPSYFDGKAFHLGQMVEILCLGVSPQGELVGGNSAGMLYFDGQEWHTTPTVRELANPLIRSIHFTANGDGWVGTKEGIVRFRRPKWQWAGHSAPFLNDGHAFYASPDQPPLAVDAENRLVEYTEEGWTAKCQLPGPATFVQFMSRPVNGTVFILNGDTVHEVKFPECTVARSIPLPANFAAEGIVQTSRGELFVYNYAGAFIYSGEAWTPYPATRPNDDLRSVVEISDSELVACYASSFEVWRDGQVTFRLGERDVETHYAMAYAMKRRNGEFWMGTRGLYIYDPRSSQFVTSRTGLVSDRIFYLHEAADGTMWAGSEHRGVSSFRDGRWVSFSHGDGLPNDKLLYIGEHPAGTIWVATRNYGLYRYQPASGAPDTQITAHPDELAPKSAAVFSFRGYDAWGTTAEKDLEYSWRIVPLDRPGADAAWSPYSPANTIAVPPLASGTYAFEVRAADRDRSTDPTPARVTVRVLSPLWMRHEFVIPVTLLIVLAAGLVVVIVRKAEALSQSEKSYRTIFNAAGDAVLVHDPATGEVIDVNQRAVEMFGYSREELMGVLAGHVGAGLLYEDAAACRARWAAAQDGPLFAEATAKRKNGSIFAAEVRFTRAAIRGKKRLLETVRDVTERRRAEETVRRLAMAIEQAAEVVIITDVDGTIEYVNPAFVGLTGYTEDEAIGQTPRILKSGKHPAAFYERMWRLAEMGEVWNGQLTNRKKDGALYEQETTITALRDRDGRIINYVAVGKDVTREVRMEARLRQAQKLEAIGTLAGGIAHDFNNILSPILGFTEIVRDDLPEGSSARANLEEVLRAGGRARDLVHQILTFSRQAETERAPVRVAAVVSEALKLLRATIPASIEIREDVGVPSAMAFADPTLVHQVVMNLGTNAYHAMENTGGVLDVSLRVEEISTSLAASHPRLRAGQRYICLAVCDTGTGMDSATLERIFDPFFTTKEMGKGTGLGLATVHGIVMNMGGDIAVKSEPGQGTCFHVYFPQIEGEQPAAPALQEHTPLGNGEHVLLVDDEQAVLEFTRQLLLRLNYRVTALSSGRAALTQFQEDPGQYDLIITDHAMPGITGTVLAAEARHVRANIPIILVTGFSESVSPENVRAHGIAEFLQKPFARAALARAVKTALASADAPSPVAESVD